MSYYYLFEGRKLVKDTDKIKNTMSDIGVKIPSIYLVKPYGRKQIVKFLTEPEKKIQC